LNNKSIVLLNFILHVCLFGSAQGSKHIFPPAEMLASADEVVIAKLLAVQPGVQSPVRFIPSFVLEKGVDPIEFTEGISVAVLQMKVESVLKGTLRKG